ncbi:MAG: replication initiator protein [Microviridae sp.]|nr:MAG: replication initiator protein [Microviridae sp.]
MCLYPRLIKNRKYTENAKNGGIIPPLMDERLLYVPVGCGRCIECRKQQARQWQVRLLEDIKTNTNGIFVTLTFSDEAIKGLIEQKPTKHWASLTGLDGYNLDNEIATRAVRLFLERWRKKFGKSVRHWFITEIGGHGSENIHLHGIIWTNHSVEDIQERWEYGFTYPNKKQYKGNYVNGKTVNYITKYITKADEKHKEYKSKILSSKGIGANYTKTVDSKSNKFNDKEPDKTKESYRTPTGHKINLPIYWRNKIYTDEEREKLWIIKLDKEERYVMGEKVSVKNGEEEYNKLLKWYQERNKELGYGDYKKDWKKIQYEGDMRNIRRITRINRAKARQNKYNNKKNAEKK